MSLARQLRAGKTCLFVMLWMLIEVDSLRCGIFQCEPVAGCQRTVSVHGLYRFTMSIALASAILIAPASSFVFIQFSAYSGVSGPGLQTNSNDGLYRVSGSYELYNGSAAVSYAYMVHTKYYGKAYYPAGINESVLQKNLDYYGSEDCAHFVSEALIAGGLTALAKNPPGDNLTGYDGGKFVGSYGIVGVYRLADYLAGYDLPVFPANPVEEAAIGYQPIPASYEGTPFATVYYVENESILPSYLLSPGDVIVDGGVGNGHAMLYVGGGKVIQTDPAMEWIYSPGVDDNISVDGMLTLNGSNVSAIYIHIPVFTGKKYVHITALLDSVPLQGDSARVPDGSRILLIASFPDGIGAGNYSYRWYDNGNLISSSFAPTLAFIPLPGMNSLKVVSQGSNGTAISNYTIITPSQPQPFPLEWLIPATFAAALAALWTGVELRHRHRK